MKESSPTVSISLWNHHRMPVGSHKMTAIETPTNIRNEIATTTKFSQFFFLRSNDAKEMECVRIIFDIGQKSKWVNSILSLYTRHSTGPHFLYSSFIWIVFEKDLLLFVCGITSHRIESDDANCYKTGDDIVTI